MEITTVYSTVGTSIHIFIFAFPAHVSGVNRHSRPSTYPLKAEDLLYVPTALTFRISVFCPQRIYVFCVDLRTNSDFFPIQQ